MEDEHDRRKDIEAEGQRAAVYHDKAQMHPVRGSAAAQERARALAETVGPIVARQGLVPVEEAARALEEIAKLSAQAWGTEDEGKALRQINEVALLAWANLRRRP
jgi:hypothetical protein